MKSALDDIIKWLDVSACKPHSGAYTAAYLLGYSISSHSAGWTLIPLCQYLAEYLNGEPFGAGPQYTQIFQVTGIKDTLISGLKQYTQTDNYRSFPLFHLLQLKFQLLLMLTLTLCLHFNYQFVHLFSITSATTVLHSVQLKLSFQLCEALTLSAETSTL